MSTNSELKLEYTGTEQPPSEGTKDLKGREYRPYIPSDELKEVVRLAIALDMPLLLEGDPGCGKTCLAGAIAYEFTQKYDPKDKDGKPVWYPFEVWNITSATRAADGKYTYDALRRLRDAQLAGSNLEQLERYMGEEQVASIIQNLEDQGNYLTLGPLGEAFKRMDYRPVLLIDEIDKADSDFPNDLLREIEDFRFEIPETGEIVPDPESKDHVKKPIIIITSNREKPLPDPFLRRCIYYYVGFPSQERLVEIIHQRFGKGTKARQDIYDKAIAQFLTIRRLLEKRPGSRAPGTSEFLKFLNSLLGEPSKTAKQKLDKLGEQRPLLGILVKNQADIDFLRQKLTPSKADE